MTDADAPTDPAADAPDDLALLRRYVAEGSERAFTALVERHLGLVYAAALRQLHGAEHRAQDVAQSVFIDLARQAPALVRRTEILGWLYTSTHFAAAKLKRTEQRRAHREQEAHAMQQLDSPSAPAPDWDRLRPVLDDALLALPEPDRAVILLRFFQQRRFADVGRQLGLSENTARMRLDRALDKLRAQLARRGIASTAAALTTALAQPALTAAPAGLAASVSAAAITSTSAVTFATLLLMNKPALIASAIALAALLFGTYEFNQLRIASAAQLTAESNLAAARRQLAAATASPPTPPPEWKDETFTRQLTLASTPAPRAGNARVLQPNFARAGGFFLGEDVSAPPDPKERETFTTLYAPFVRQLNLTPEQQEKLIQVLVDAKAYRNELFAAMYSGPQEPSDATLQEVWRRSDQERDQQLAAALGDDVVKAFQQFEAISPLRQTTYDLADDLFQLNAPLSPAQAEQLLAIMVANSTFVDGKFDRRLVNNDAILAQAQTVLTPEQLPALRRKLDHQQVSDVRNKIPVPVMRRTQ